jgi:hypothetical protein
VANVTTERIWLDTTVLDDIDPFPPSPFISWSAYDVSVLMIRIYPGVVCYNPLRAHSQLDGRRE